MRCKATIDDNGVIRRIRGKYWLTTKRIVFDEAVSTGIVILHADIIGDNDDINDVDIA